ncbi:MAG TPA: ATP phosphoribosyltransferase regulatory subunit [Nitrosomonas nitrosa]|jgi:ATP phosphoribosyltransferase regulatory subunit|uniref:ATP phosphoribosyltransferase regulatory subunit n=1 Tax=Nitrosomonas nitrosa TaxID=52442 RepID=UPI000D327FBE|nr:ATP phosphoribosyltransferase regulatory subunit [Nitrosomonas nitrosa]MCO6435146.1 ATP phosphoribosyltransferase regulatory subunit [Nitrosomonas nitrosa]PTR04798.1 ATP phosphoribosyltransferase regulatory subunit [Nitrosomonas nitrosa]HBZ30530.1 ATP phosphoribosyltransferase regulatory subunit [Nitrosomonas nitrosa]HNP50778.1 ATP phosphoribosyltransferase regulatory subunit [Nitrosomonas nitrosa]
MRNWLLPEYIEDVLPSEALRIEKMRRRVLDLLLVHGYHYVIPPLLEYVESLLSGSGSDMDLRMFKVLDQLSGRMMGLRADITPQTARIDAHLLNAKGVTRLCYASSVLHTVPCEITRTREPFQIGAELYGHAGLESDLEIQRLMLKCLMISGIDKIHLDLGHVAIFRSLIRDTGVLPEFEVDLYNVLQTKDTAALKELLSTGLDKRLDRHTRDALMLLPELYGDKKILIEARKMLPGYPEIENALHQLTVIEDELKSYVNTITFDLADLRGYHYHTGMVFAAYVQESANAIALGGRYDEIGKAFGRARPATGFSMDLRELSRLTRLEDCPKAILAPYKRDDEALDKTMERLRAEGHIVITDLPGNEIEEDPACYDKKLIFHNGVWEVVDI